MSDVEPAAEEEAVPIDIWLSRQRVGRDELWREIVRSPVWHGDVPAARTLECSEATFDEGLAFDKAHIDRASFADATFEGDVHLSRIFAVELNLPRVTIHGELRLRWCMLDRLDLTGATVDGPVVFTDVGARRIVLDAATFGAPVRADISAEVVTCGRATFDGGLDLNVRWAEVDLEETSFGQPSVVAFLDKELPVATPLAERLHEEGRADRPRIVSLRRANVDGLLLSGVDLRAAVSSRRTASTVCAWRTTCSSRNRAAGSG